MSLLKINPDYQKRVYGLDVFRAVAIVLVVIGHGSFIVNSNALKSLSEFWKRRWYRTLPNYYLILLVNYLLVRFEIINGDISQFNWKFLLFLHNFSGPFVDFF